MLQQSSQNIIYYMYLFDILEYIMLKHNAAILLKLHFICGHKRFRRARAISTVAAGWSINNLPNGELMR